MKTRTLTLTILPILLAALPAGAEEDCASNDWFCASEAESSSSESGSDSDESTTQTDQSETPPEPSVIDSRTPDEARPRPRPRVVYGPPSSSPSRVGTEDALSSKEKEKERLRHFGFNLRLSSVLQDRDPYTHADAGLTGFGVGFRFIPVSFLALEPGIDGFAGHDQYGRERTETTLSFNSIFTLNPNDPIQLYGLVGVFTTTAETKGMDSGNLLRSGAGRSSYVGAQVGAGVELRLDPALGFHADIIGYTRQRNELPHPSETSADLRRDGGGGLVRAGMSLYF